MNILLIEQYSQLIQELVQHTDDIIRTIVSDNELRQEIKDKWYPTQDDIDWGAIVKAEADSYAFDLSIYPDNFFNE